MAVNDERNPRSQPDDLIGAASGSSRVASRAPRVREDFLTGIRSGVNGTPTFFVNGIRHNGGYDTASLLAAIEAAV